MLFVFFVDEAHGLRRQIEDLKFEVIDAKDELEKAKEVLEEKEKDHDESCLKIKNLVSKQQEIQKMCEYEKHNMEAMIQREETEKSVLNKEKTVLTDEVDRLTKLLTSQADDRQAMEQKFRDLEQTIAHLKARN